MENTASTLSQQGMTAFAAEKFEDAADFFQKAADAYQQNEQSLEAAEARNNLSVALVKLKRGKDALQAVEGTEAIFEAANDVKRKAMAMGNKAAALEILGKTDEAIPLYEETAKLLHELGEDEMKTIVLQTLSELRLRKGQISGTAIDAIDALISNPKPSLKQKILKFVFRRFAKL